MQLHSSLLHQNYEEFFFSAHLLWKDIFYREHTNWSITTQFLFKIFLCLTIVETSIYIWQFLNKALLIIKQKMTHQLTLKMFEGFTFIIFP